MIVDWLRACYESDFCVNEETGETIRGRYRWADPGAQVYPYPHNFGSAVWLDPEDRGAGMGLGDQFTNVTKDDGAAPLVRPLTQRFAVRRNGSCSPTNGPSMAMTADVFSGLPKACYANTLNPCSTYEAKLDTTSKTTWCFVATVCDLLYAADASVEDLISAYLPDVFNVESSLDGSGLAPQWVAWQAKCGRGIICAGTSNFQQAALQVFYGAQGPWPVGEFYTSRFWWQQSELLRDIFTTFAGPHVKRTFMGGHSYGGAVAALMTAAETTRQNIDEYSLVTLGGPRFGNGQVYAKLSATKSAFVQCEDDPVPSLPPTYPDLLDLLPILGTLRYFFWQRWAPPPVQQVVDAMGLVHESAGWNAPLVAATTIAGIIRDRSLMPTFEFHKIEAYKERLCPPIRYRIIVTNLRYTGAGNTYNFNFNIVCSRGAIDLWTNPHEDLQQAQFQKVRNDAGAVIMAWLFIGFLGPGIGESPAIWELPPWAFTIGFDGNPDPIAISGDFRTFISLDRLQIIPF